MSQSLNPISYITLGLVERLGEATSYDLKNWADGSIGYFWSFSRAGLYKEPARLIKLGLLDERQETKGRRRRLYSLTEKGRHALSDWLAASDGSVTEIRDMGLLKLYFAQNGTQAAFDSLIQDQIKAHADRLTVYRELRTELAAKADWRFYAAALEMGLKYEEMSIEFWKELSERDLRIDD